MVITTKEHDNDTYCSTDISRIQSEVPREPFIISLRSRRTVFQSVNINQKFTIVHQRSRLSVYLFNLNSKIVTFANATSSASFRFNPQLLLLAIRLDSLTLPLRFRSPTYLHFVALVDSPESIPPWHNQLPTFRNYILLQLYQLWWHHLPRQE